MTTKSEHRQDLNPPAWTLGERLRKARNHAGMEQVELADALGVARNTISNYETDRRHPSKALIRYWAEVCGVSNDWLVDGDGASTTSYMLCTTEGLPRSALVAA